VPDSCSSSDPGERTDRTASKAEIYGRRRTSGALRGTRYYYDYDDVSNCWAAAVQHRVHTSRVGFPGPVVPLGPRESPIVAAYRRASDWCGAE
jgi:hypothetical protein